MSFPFYHKLEDEMEQKKELDQTDTAIAIEKYIVEVKGIKFELKVTYGFWRHCGFKREEMNIIENNVEAYLTALKLAVFYGNKNKYNWNCFADMEKMLTDSDFDECSEDYTQKISMAAIYYMPKKLRDITLKKMKDIEKQYGLMIEQEMDNVMSIDSKKSDIKKK